MGALDQLESFLQGLLERPASLLGSRQLRPLDLASALTREFESRAVTAGDRVVVPGGYRIEIATSDRARLTLSVADLEREMTGYIRGLAVERDLSLSSPAEVRIVANPALEAGQIRVRSMATQDPRASAASHGALPGDRRVSGGQRGAGLDAESWTAAPRQDGRLGARLVRFRADGSELRAFQLRQATTTLGRRSDNDVAIDDTNISRHHARVDFQDGAYYLTDLDSTNGTRLNGRGVRARDRLHDGDIIELGLQRFRFDELAGPRENGSD